MKFESKLLSRFWGHPIYIGATVLLPKGYDAHPDVRYPAIYLQGHFSLSAPFGFTTEPDKPGTKSWDIVCSLPDGEVRVRALENHWVQIGSGRSTF